MLGKHNKWLLFEVHSHPFIRLFYVFYVRAALTGDGVNRQ